MTSDELRVLVDGVRYLEAALGSPVDKDEVATELAPMRALFGRSLVAARALPTRHVRAAPDLVAKQPRSGIPPTRLEAVVGQRLRRALRPDELLSGDDIEIVGVGVA